MNKSFVDYRFSPPHPRGGGCPPLDGGRRSTKNTKKHVQLFGRGAGAQTPQCANDAKLEIKEHTPKKKGGVFHWSKVSGPGDVTFSPKDTTKTSTGVKANKAGTYKVKVIYTLKGEQTDDVFSITLVKLKLTTLKVSDPKGLWWFNGEHAINYGTWGTLTANGVKKGKFKWDVIAGTGKINLDNGGADADSITATDDNNVRIKPTGASGPKHHDDVAIKLTYNGKKLCRNGARPCKYELTVFTAKEEVRTKVEDKDKKCGYASLHHFKINDQYGDVLPYKIELNEHWTEKRQDDWKDDHPDSTNWPQGNAEKWMVDPSGDIDGLTVVAPAAKYVPASKNPQNPRCSDSPVIHWNGEHYVGSLHNGKGSKVLSRKWQYYIDHARREKPSEGEGESNDE